MALTLDNSTSVLTDYDLTQKPIDDETQPPQGMASRDYVSNISNKSFALDIGAESAAQTVSLIPDESPTSGLPHTIKRCTVKKYKSTKGKNKRESTITTTKESKGRTCRLSVDSSKSQCVHVNENENKYVVKVINGLAT
jgi:hypothetical protein